ncbi:MAG: helix-turn-helix transcriptional regulator [Bacteroidales bacterium]|nr:helix-turn-helix transcriptional regulator [Bacteroidales bacterium]
MKKKPFKFVQSLYLQPNKNPYEDDTEWLKPEFKMMSLALSCLQLKKYYGNIDLYCNYEAADLLSNILQLPYNEINTELSDINIPIKELKIFPKIWTLNRQDSPFLYFDNDVYVFTKISDDILNNKLIVINSEPKPNKTHNTNKILADDLTFIPECLNTFFYKNKCTKNVNTGIIGGKNFKFYQEYSETALEFIEKNREKINKVNIENFNTIIEQDLFCIYTQKKKVEPEFLTKYYGHNAGNLCENSHCKYLQLSENYKKDITACTALAAKLREIYPEYYYRIINLFKKKKITLFTDFYDNQTTETKEDVAVLTEKSRFAFYKNQYSADISSILKNRAEKHSLKYLQNAINETFNDEVPNDVTEDFQKFKNDVLSLENTFKISEFYLYGKNMEFQNMYSVLDNSNLQNVILTKTLGIEIIKTKYDFGNIYSKKYRCGNPIYQNIDVKKPGEYYNLIVPNVYYGCSVYSINPTEIKVLEILNKPMTASQILNCLNETCNEKKSTTKHNKCENQVNYILQKLILQRAVSCENMSAHTTAQKIVKHLDRIIYKNNLREDIPETSYDQIKTMIKVFDAYARLNNKTFYVFDYTKNDIVYMSEHQLFNFDISSKEIKNKGYNFFFTMIVPEEHDMLTEVARNNIAFMEKLPKELRTKVVLSYNFHVIQNGKKWLLNIKKTPLELSQDGKVWFAIFEISHSFETSEKNVEIICTEKKKKWKLDFEKHQWIESEIIELAELEKNVLQLAVKGCSLNETAEILCKSNADIKFHKRKILQKLESENIMEAYSKAEKYSLL